MKTVLFITALPLILALSGPQAQSNAPKLPWVEGTDFDCGFSIEPQESCYGSARYCNEALYPKGSYRDAQACLADRENASGVFKGPDSHPPGLKTAAHSPLKPFYPSPTGIQFATFDRGSEEVLGTKAYCAENQYPYTEEEGEVYKDENECLAAREPESSSSVQPSPGQATDSNRIIYPDEWERISYGSNHS